MFGLSIMHWVIVIAVFTVLFGRNKVSSVMGDLAGGIREFRKGLTEAASPPVSLPKVEAKDAPNPPA